MEENIKMLYDLGSERDLLLKNVMGKSQIYISLICRKMRVIKGSEKELLEKEFRTFFSIAMNGVPKGLVYRGLSCEKMKEAIDTLEKKILEIEERTRALEMGKE